MELSPPLRLIIAARYSPDAKSAWDTYQTNQAIDWPLLAQQARQTGLAPLLYDGLQKLEITDVPPAIQTQLRQIYLDTALKNTIILNQLNNILEILQSADIPVIVLKGAALAQAIYGNVALRPMIDIDLLLHFDNLFAAIEQLNQLGFQLISVKPTNVHQELYWFWNQLHLHKHGNNKQSVELELHWHLLDNPYYAQLITTSALFERATNSRIETQKTLVLSPQDQLLHLCTHNFYHHRGQASRTGPDIAQTIQFYKDQIDWENFLVMIRQKNVCLAIQTELTQAHSDWYADVPIQFLNELSNLTPKINERLFLLSQRNKYWRQLRTFWTVPSVSLKFRFLWRWAFPTKAYKEQKRS